MSCLLLGFTWLHLISMSQSLTQLSFPQFLMKVTEVIASSLRPPHSRFKPEQGSIMLGLKIFCFLYLVTTSCSLNVPDNKDDWQVLESMIMKIGDIPDEEHGARVKRNSDRGVT